MTEGEQRCDREEEEERKMSTVSLSKVVQLQHETSQVRNICILAHVDHGKTTLSDCLISSNGIISERLAGTVRYLDSREDEQERGITMKSSAISLVFHHEKLQRDYLINLIDSPGHVDFSSDVSTAVRLCDGALVVVDVIEGVAIQTHAVLRQAWEERLQPCLVLNKVDRLITELHLDPIEAYEHLSKIIERVNGILQGFVSASVMDEAEKKRLAGESEKDGESDWLLEYDEEQERALIFSPEKGNVVFASAVDSWAFRVIDFVPMVSELLGLPPKRVLKSLWGNFFYNAKTKKIIEAKQVQASVTTGESSRSRPPMFATFILQSIWQVYGATVLESKPKRLEKIISTLGLAEKIKARDVQKGGKMALRSVMHAWLPVTRAVLAMVVRCVPNPSAAQKRRVQILWPRDQLGSLLHHPQHEEQLQRTRAAVSECDPNGPLVAFVTKIFAVERKMLSPGTLAKIEALQKKYDSVASERQAILPTNRSEVEEEQQEFFVAFARVFSGTIRPGQPVFVLGPKYVPGNKERERHAAEVSTGVLPMLMMSTELVALESVPAGNILAFAGLDRDILKTATVTDSPIAISLSKMPSQSAPILRVSLEPVNPVEWPQLAQGLRLLNRADPVAEVRVQPNGEHILGAIGELHLERCIKDLKDRFAKIEIKVSKPIAIFRETIIPYAPDDAPLPRISPVLSLAPISIQEEEARIASDMAAAEAVVDSLSLESSNGDSDTPRDQPPHPPTCLPLSKRVFPGGRVVATTAENAVSVVLRSIPLPEVITRKIEELRPLLSKLVDATESQVDEDDATTEQEALENFTRRSSSRRVTARASSSGSLDHVATSVETQESQESQQDNVESIDTIQEKVRTELKEAFEQAGQEYSEGIFERVWSFGPRGVGCNVLLNMTDAKCPLRARQYGVLFPQHEDTVQAIKEEEEEGEEENEYVGSDLLWDEVGAGILAGFQLACRAGPICEEPLWGVAVVVEQVVVKVEDQQAVAAMRQKKQATIAGQVMTNMRDGIRRSIEVHRLQHEHGVPTGCQLRLVEGVLSCLLQCHVESHQGDQLGKMYSVLSKRRAKIVSEDMWEGTSIFTVQAEIPVVESFNLGDDLRRQTSGAASTPQLVFSHWSILQENPFFRATTEDELEEYGERGYEESYLAHNLAHKYLQQIRKRKGLATSEKVVVAAEKQRTLAKKK